jgi:hypothetical protein
VAQSGEHLDPVGLDLLPWAAPVSLLATAQIVLDGGPVEDEARRQALDDRNEGGPV